MKSQMKKAIRNFLFLSLIMATTQSASCLPAPVPGSNFTPAQLELHHQLLNAITNNNIKEVTTLLARGLNINANQMGGVTPLTKAIEHGHEELCRLLINGGADVNKHVYFHTTPLMEAVRHGKTSIVKLLLEHGARLDNACRNMLFCASSNGSEDICNLLLATNFYTTDDRSTALIYAASKGHIGSCKLLLAHGADLNFTGRLKDDWENFLGERIQTTPLRAAAKNGHLGTLIFLMKAKFFQPSHGFPQR